MSEGWSDMDGMKNAYGHSGMDRSGATGTGKGGQDGTLVLGGTKEW